MKELLLYLVTQLVEHPEEIKIDEATEQDRSVLTLHVHPEDMGKVIGKQGRIIRALRDIMKLAAAKQHVYVDIALAEDQPLA